MDSPSEVLLADAFEFDGLTDTNLSDMDDGLVVRSDLVHVGHVCCV